MVNCSDISDGTSAGVRRNSIMDFFNKTLHEIILQKSVVEYLPTIPQLPEYDVCKKFLDNINEMMKELDLEHIFTHADEQVYARLAHIIWKYPVRYKNFVILMAGFHELRVRQKTIHKRYAC